MKVSYKPQTTVLLVIIFFFQQVVHAQIKDDNLIFKNGESLVWIGNSITHQCRYSQYIEDYIFTRFPDLRLHLHTAGVSGDKAGNVLIRFDRDIARHEPNYATILLGMNDGSYRTFDKAVFETYQKDMLSLLNKLDSIGTKPIIMSPTMFDAKQKRSTGSYSDESYLNEYNGLLAYYSAWLREVAREKEYRFIDLRASLEKITSEKRKFEKDFTLIPDGIHPSPVGLAVMATDIIKDFFGDSPLSEILITMEGRKKGTSNAKGGQINNLAFTGKEIEFEFLPESLPWVIPDDASNGLILANASLLNSEPLTITGLSRGNYKLFVDSIEIGSFTDLEFAKGIELNKYTMLPHYQHSKSIADLNRQRNVEIYKSRELWFQKKMLQEKAKIIEGDEEDNQKALIDLDTKAGICLGNAERILQKIYQSNSPKKRIYKIVKQ